MVQRQEAQMKTRTVTPEKVVLPLDQFQHVEFSVSSGRNVIDTDRIREEQGYTVRCASCGTWFEAQRITATFCGPTCRSRAAREPANRALRISQAQGAVRALCRAMPKRGNSDEFEALQKLATIIKNALELVEEG